MAINNNTDLNILSQIVKSDFAKSVVVIIISFVGFTWTIASFKNDLEKSITTMNQEIKITNIILENRINKLEIKQQVDIDYIKDKFVRGK